LKLTQDHSFADAFPNTTVPRMSLLNNQPRLQKEDFSALLVLKLQQARRYTGLDHNPTCYPSLISGWIRSLLRDHIKGRKTALPSAQKKKSKTKVSEQKTKQPGPTSTPIQKEFVPAEKVEAPADTSSPPSADVRSELTLKDFVLSADNKTISMTTSAPLPSLSELNFSEVRVLTAISRSFLMAPNNDFLTRMPGFEWHDFHKSVLITKHLFASLIPSVAQYFNGQTILIASDPTSPAGIMKQQLLAAIHFQISRF